LLFKRNSYRYAWARARRRALNARQFGLKLIANVTYGYTAAGFSGRMPMAGTVPKRHAQMLAKVPKIPPPKWVPPK
jgi:DNA polymerase elongation subunit (family B)